MRTIADSFAFEHLNKLHASQKTSISLKCFYFVHIVVNIIVIYTFIYIYLKLTFELNKIKYLYD